MPVTIGALDNVPAPGDPITSPWAQEASGYVVHPFPTVAARTAAWPAPAVGSMSIITSRAIPDVFFGGAWRPLPGQSWVGVLGQSFTTTPPNLINGGSLVGPFPTDARRYLLIANLVTDASQVASASCVLEMHVNGGGITRQYVYCPGPYAALVSIASWSGVMASAQLKGENVRAGITGGHFVATDQGPV
jgi:hypothetical protein